MVSIVYLFPFALSSTVLTANHSLHDILLMLPSVNSYSIHSLVLEVHSLIDCSDSSINIIDFMANIDVNVH